MRNISFALTTDAVINREKTVTRRLGWKTLVPGTLLQGCKKCMGLKPGEKLERLVVIKVVSVKRERLDAILNYAGDETASEGFPDLHVAEFMDMFCKHMKCTPETEVTRIEFEYV